MKHSFRSSLFTLSLLHPISFNFFIISIAYGFKTIMSLAFQKTATKEDKEKKEDNEIKEEPKDISE